MLGTLPPVAISLVVTAIPSLPVLGHLPIAVNVCVSNPSSNIRLFSQSIECQFLDSPETAPALPLFPVGQEGAGNLGFLPGD